MTIERKTKAAEISKCGTYRYSLMRSWDIRAPMLVYIMFNPSTADGLEDDATIRKCIGFAKRMQYGGIFVVNLFAYRATDPAKLKEAGYPVGEENDHRIRLHCGEWGEGTRVVCAWGSIGKNHLLVQKRVDQVMQMLRDDGVTPYVLELNKGGIPAHPLMLPYDCKLMEWKPWNI